MVFGSIEMPQRTRSVLARFIIAGCWFFMSCHNYRCSFLKFQLEIGSQIGGSGKVTEHILKDALEIKTCGDMVLKGSLLYALFTQSSAGSSISCFLVGLLLSTEGFCCLLLDNFL